MIKHPPFDYLITGRFDFIAPKSQAPLLVLKDKTPSLDFGLLRLLCYLISHPLLLSTNKVRAQRNAQLWVPEPSCLTYLADT
ncbi:hypothetical protein ES703_43172 [subsurface metagenome]